jgi:hypothetical protein
MHDITIRDLVLEGALTVDPGFDPNATRSFNNKYNRGGIIFLGDVEGLMRNIRLHNVTVRNCT